MGGIRARIEELVALPTLRRLRRSLNSSPVIPGALRQLIGGFAWSSGDYTVVGTDETARAYVSGNNGWHRPIVARRQAALWSRPIERADRADVRNLKEALARSIGTTVLEVGCGPAYNVTFVGERHYIGLDSSRAQLHEAHASQNLIAGSATDLPIATASLDIVIDGGTVMHVPQWEKVLAEECRVARNSLILHTLSVTDSAPTTFLTKRAYGYPVPELVFARHDVESLLITHGFRVMATWQGIDYNLNDIIGIATASETWLCERVITRTTYP